MTQKNESASEIFGHVEKPIFAQWAFLRAEVIRNLRNIFIDMITENFSNLEKDIYI